MISRPPVARAGQWLKRRQFPLLAMAILVVIEMASTTWWGPKFEGISAWQLPNDLWGTLLAAHRLLHLEIGSLYTPPTGLVSLPGTAVVLVPAVALIDALGLGIALPGVHNPQPGAWLIAGPYEIVLSSIVLFAADAIAERSGVSRAKRLLLAAAQAVALWNVAGRWGHPEDAVAVGLLLFGALALNDAKPERSAWLVGAAIAVQPLVLLAVPIIVAALDARRRPWYLLRAAIPAGVLLGVALAANWGATMRAVGNQPNWPAVDQPTPWIAFAPRLGHGAVAAGPTRIVAILLACACAVFAARSWKARGWKTTTARSGPVLQELLWWIALTLALRCVFEAVMVAYYVWPVLAAALVSATASWPRLVRTAIVSSALTFLTQISWHGRWGEWGWWTMVLVCLFLLLAGAWRRPAPERDGSHEFGPDRSARPVVELPFGRPGEPGRLG